MNKMYRYSIIIVLLFLSCSPFSVALAEYLVIDQQQTLGPSSLNIFNLMPTHMGQEFVPDLTPLVRVSVMIQTMELQGDDTITMNIREATIFGTILGTASKLVPEGDFDSNRWIDFDFPTPLGVNPGSMYVIELITTKATFGWNLHPGDIYPRGDMVFSSGPTLDADFAFITYSLRSVGGEIIPQNTLVLMAPWILVVVAVIGMGAKAISRKTLLP